ncbi:MAG: anti-sigma factor antagonist [Verrucomicrobia bacterium]|nr:MAG: anti-sigma factor antagonist [Verrucomicrobiota bacterium]
MSAVPSILVGCFGQEAWIRVESRGTFQNSPGLKEFSKRMLQKGFRIFVVDLEKCELMDSTFMGTLAGIALRLRDIGQGSLEVINVNDRNSNLLESLGLAQLFNVRKPGDANAPPAPDAHALEEAKPKNPDASREIILTAHQALVAARSENAERFRDVIEYLKQENPKKYSDF